MHFMSRVFSNTTSLMTSVCMQYVGAMAASSYLSLYADKLLKGENQSRKYVHEVLVNCLFKLAQEKVWLGELTVPQWP